MALGDGVLTLDGASPIHGLAAQKGVLSLVLVLKLLARSLTQRGSLPTDVLVLMFQPAGLKHAPSRAQSTRPRGKEDFNTRSAALWRTAGNLKIGDMLVTLVGLVLS